MNTEKKLEELSWEELLEATSTRQIQNESLREVCINTEAHKKGGRNVINKINQINRDNGHWDKWSKINGKKAFDKTAIYFYQCDMDGNIIKEWKGIKECARELGLTWQHISAVLQGRRKSHKGFIWKYKN